MTRPAALDTQKHQPIGKGESPQWCKDERDEIVTHSSPNLATSVTSGHDHAKPVCVTC